MVNHQSNLRSTIWKDLLSWNLYFHLKMANMGLPKCRVFRCLVSIDLDSANFQIVDLIPNLLFYSLHQDSHWSISFFSFLSITSLTFLSFNVHNCKMSFLYSLRTDIFYILVILAGRLQKYISNAMSLFPSFFYLYVGPTHNHTVTIHLVLDMFTDKHHFSYPFMSYGHGKTSRYRWYLRW